MRHFLRELRLSFSSLFPDAEKLGKDLVSFINLWVALNCDILRGGQVTLEKCLRTHLLLSPHPTSHLKSFIEYAKAHASSIDSYVMSGTHKKMGAYKLNWVSENI